MQLKVLDGEAFDLKQSKKALPCHAEQSHILLLEIFFHEAKVLDRER